MENKEIITRRDALKRMSKTAMAVAVVSMFPRVNALASEATPYSNYDNYSNYKDYNNYKNYNDYSNYDNYRNYRNYSDCD